MLVASSRADVRNMIAYVSQDAAKFGLKMHAGKTNILTTDGKSRQTPASCGGLDVFHTAELDNRLSMGWSALFKFKGALCNKHIPVKARIALLVLCYTMCLICLLRLDRDWRYGS